jgi:transposase-like protein
MKDGGLDTFGAKGGDVEIDETFIGRDFAKKPKGEKKGRGFEHKNKVLSLIDRKTGRSRSIVIDNLKMTTVLPILHANIAPEARVLTDDAGYYQSLRMHFADHGFTRHMVGEYVSRNDRTVHTNTVEGFFSIFKRGMKGVYQHCAHNHLNRYLAEFDFRYSNRLALGIEDADRANILLQGVKGKRLTYKTAH